MGIFTVVALVIAFIALRRTKILSDEIKLLRRVGLLVLASCLLRVFMVDTRSLSDTAQTAAFLVLGLCLVGAAWLYTRYSEELKNWL